MESPLILLLAGFVVLGLAGEALLRGAVTLADKLRVSPLIIGLTIIAFGTSAPELTVSLNAALNGQPDISIGIYRLANAFFLPSYYIVSSFKAFYFLVNY